MPLRESQRHLITKHTVMKQKISMAAELSRESMVSVLYRQELLEQLEVSRLNSLSAKKDCEQTQQTSTLQVRKKNLLKI